MRLKIGVLIIILEGIVFVGLNIIKREITTKLFIGIILIFLGFIKFYYDNKDENIS
jgi:hypothetical protein